MDNDLNLKCVELYIIVFKNLYKFVVNQKGGREGRLVYILLCFVEVIIIIIYIY